ncbi:MAG: hypothetical protein WCP28_05840 [Actinomycetes bacterium]
MGWWSAEYPPLEPGVLAPGNDNNFFPVFPEMRLWRRPSRVLSWPWNGHENRAVMVTSRGRARLAAPLTAAGAVISVLVIGLSACGSGVAGAPTPTPTPTPGAVVVTRQLTQAQQAYDDLVKSYQSCATWKAAGDNTEVHVSAVSGPAVGPSSTYYKSGVAGASQTFVGVSLNGLALVDSTVVDPAFGADTSQAPSPVTDLLQKQVAKYLAAAG